MPSSWLNKYGYGSTSGQPAASSQPSWTAKYGAVSPAPTISPAFKNAEKNKNAPAVSPAFQNAKRIQSMQGSIISNQQIQQPQSIWDTAKAALFKVGEKLPLVADKFTKAVKNLPEAHFADDEDMWTPVGFAKTVAQSIINTPSQAFKGAASLGENIGAGTSTPQQVAADIAAAAQLPLLILSGGGSGVLKAGLQTGAKGVAKQIGKEAVTGAGFGALTGFQTGKEINNVPDYLKNFLVNIGIGAGAGAGLKAAGLVVAPLAKGLSNKLGSVFINNADNSPKVKEVRMDPKVAQNTILVNDLEKTPVGKAVLKESLAATDQNAHVSIMPLESGKYELPSIGKVNVSTAQIYDPATFNKAAQQTRLQTIEQATQKVAGEIQEQVKTDRVSKLGLRVEQTAIEKKLTKDLGDLPQYKSINMKEQASKASELIQSDPERALRVALGQEAPPSGLTPESVFKAVESSITTPEQAVRLANSPLVTEASTLGQRIKSLDVKTAESPVEAMKQVINARTKAIESKVGSVDKAIAKTTEEIKKKVKVPNKYDWNAFISSIQC